MHTFPQPLARIVRRRSVRRLLDPMKEEIELFEQYTDRVEQSCIWYVTWTLKCEVQVSHKSRLKSMLNPRCRRGPSLIASPVCTFPYLFYIPTTIFYQTGTILSEHCKKKPDIIRRAYALIFIVYVNRSIYVVLHEQLVCT